MKYADYYERKRHGSPDFPIQYYYLDYTNPQYVMVPHWHTEFEIIRVVKGEFNVFLNNTEYTLNSGDILFVNCGYLHRGEPSDCIYECAVLDLNMLCRQKNDAAAKLISPLINSSVVVNTPLVQGENEIYNIIDSLLNTLRQNNEYYELEIYSLLFRLFSKLYLNNKIIHPIKTQYDNKTETITRLMDWIERNLTETITLDKLSEISGLSKKYLCRIFKEYSSKTIIDYVNELRIEKACYKIATEKESITKAAFDSGFNDLSYFCKVFKKHKGTTPKEYKKHKLS